VIKFEPPEDKPLVVIPFGTSANLKVGQKVLAIGNPFGLERTLTKGIVSSLGRPVQKDDGFVIRGMIQTDAAINPGNSGGPLLNPRGEMVGINTMIYSPSGGSVGVGFAVPVDTARRVVPELIAYGAVKRGWIEFQPVQLFPELVSYMKERGYALPVEKGVLVSTATRGGNADSAGLRGGNVPVRYGRSTFNIGGDIVVSIDGFSVATVADVYSALEDNKPGDKVKVVFWRNGTRMEITVTLTERVPSTSGGRG
jgi:S1-C subfamily serine protease